VSAQLALFPAGLDELERTGRLAATRASSLFSGFDRTLCVFLDNRHRERRERRMDERFEYLEVGFGRPGGGRAAALLGLRRAVADVRAAARAAAVDAVMAYDPHLLGLVGYAVARALRVPFAVRVISHYGLKHEHTGQIAFAPFVSRRVERAVERFLYRRARVVLVACPSHRDYVERTAGGRAHVLPYVTAQAPLFYDDAPPDPAVRRRLAPDVREMAVAVTRLVPEKYPADLIECAGRLRERPGFALLLVGEGPLRDELEAQARRLQAPVVFAGAQPPAAVRALFQTAEATVVLQGGGAITEAALSGAPIVAYDFEMNPFVVRGDEGVLVPFRDVDALADGVRRLLDDRDAARGMAARARASSRARFDEASARSAEREVARVLLARP
jgi:glycosyltransferase involved in cell wall biosynthesis